MSNNNFKNYLLNLGFSKREVSNNLKGNVYTHSVNLRNQTINVKYILVENNQRIFDTHKLLWNRNTDTSFIAVGKSKSHIINVKIKPNRDNPLAKGICIESFNYGVNSEDYKDIDIEKISKDYINSTYFFDFVRKNQRKKQEVDKDLLLNLLALRNNMLNGNNEQVVHLLILRCLFVKYLEDRKIFKHDFLSNILKSNKPQNLLNAFDEVCKINGDVFGEHRLTLLDISKKHLGYLTRFFECDYRSGQGTIFPYEFNSIPIQLISHVYEAFLKSDLKKGKGVYYTPSFVVDFMLSQTLKNNVRKNKKITILDPAVGSAAFLVESFKIIQESYGKDIDFEKKKWILENQLFGIDVDEQALQIAAFSLYLALLETEEAEFIKQKIETASPILPSLIGKTLKKTNAITENPFKGKHFGLIVSNPPWGSVPNDGLDEHKKERSVIDNKNGKYPEFNNVADYERSQAFLMKVSRWSNEDTIFTLIVKNSIFLNNGTSDFRLDFLNKYDIDTFYELSNYNKILFKKQVIGYIGEHKIETGASEPCAIIMFRNSKLSNNKLKYISPKLNKFSEYLDLIQYTSQDVSIIKQNRLIEINDYAWKVLVNESLEGLNLIEKLYQSKSDHYVIKSGRGFEPKSGEKEFGDPIYKNWIDIDCFERFSINKLKKFNWNQEFRNKRDCIFESKSIVFARRPLKRHENKLTAVVVNQNVVFKDNLVFVKIKEGEEYVKNYSLFLGLLNSSLVGYFLNQTSVQWGKGSQKIASIRTKDVESIPIPRIEINEAKKIAKLVKHLNNVNSNDKIIQIEEKIDELVFELYGLLDYEKEIIREFYQVNVERSKDKESFVRASDMKQYFEVFKDTFSLVLSKENTLSASYHLSPNVGAVISISITNKNEQTNFNDNPKLQVLNFVKSKQLKESETSKVLNEEKVKIYEKSRFFIIKSNYFKDWTKRRAMKDAKEEIEQFIQHLTK